MSNQQIVAPIGIDLGSQTSKIGVAKRGGVQIISNEASFRQTPCVVGYGSGERHIGESGKTMMKSNFKDTVVYPKRFLGLSADNPFLRMEKKYCAAKCVTKGDKIAFQVKYQGNPEQLYPEQVMAAYLNELKNIISKNNLDNKSAVIAVPSYFTQLERKALLDAAKIAELNVVRLLNESSAVALDYGMFRKAELTADPRNVLFVDFGHSKLSIFVCSFTNTGMTVLEQENNRHVGCRDIDYHIYEFYRDLFEKSSGGCDLNQSKKAIMKIMENIQRQRKILTGNIQHDMNLEYLMQQNDLHYTMTRDKFQQICTPLFKAMAESFTKMKDSISAKDIKLHSIELVGGGSRIPAFVNLVKQVFQVEPSRTLNSSETVAKGCTLMAAIKSPLFKVQEYEMTEKNFYGVKFYWNFVDGQKFLGTDSSLYPQKQGKFIYESGAKVPTSKTIKFTKKEAIEVLIEYEPCIPGFPKHLGYFVTKPQNPKEEIFGVSFKIKYTEDGLITFDDCNFAEEWIEETKVPKKKQKKEEKKQVKEGEATPEVPEKMEVEEQFEIKKTKKQKFTQIKYDSNTFDTLNTKDVQVFFGAQATMLNQDRLILQTYEKKNELQSMSYSWQQKLQSSHRQYAKPEQIPGIVEFLKSQGVWLYEDGQNCSRGVYNQRIEAVKGKINPIIKRYNNFVKITDELHSLQICLKKSMQHLNTLDKKYEHVTPEERQQGFSHIDRIRTWVRSSGEKQNLKPKWEEPVITDKQIKDHIKEISDKVKAIMGKAAPKKQQKKEQPKTQKPAQSKDQKMEVEGDEKSKEVKDEKMDIEK